MKLLADTAPKHRASSLFTFCISLYIDVRTGGRDQRVYCKGATMHLLEIWESN